MFALVNFLISIVFELISFTFDLAEQAVGEAVTVVSYIYTLAVFIPSLAVSVRRLHDIGKSGWMLLFLYVPALIMALSAVPIVLASARGDTPNMAMVGVMGVFSQIVIGVAIWFLVMWCTNSQPGANKWGNNPKENSLAEQFDNL
jgi:uncharacterized membrane protein YhaH (DUF805 family)